MNSLDAHLAQAKDELITSFRNTMAREKRLLLQEGDLSPREIDEEIAGAFQRFYAWLPSELERLRLGLN